MVGCPRCLPAQGSVPPDNEAQSRSTCLCRAVRGPRGLGGCPSGRWGCRSVALQGGAGGGQGAVVLLRQGPPSACVCGALAGVAVGRVDASSEHQPGAERRGVSEGGRCPRHPLLGGAGVRYSVSVLGEQSPLAGVRAVAEVHAARRGRGRPPRPSLPPLPPGGGCRVLAWLPGFDACTSSYSRRIAPMPRFSLAGRARTRGDTAVGGQAALREPVCEGASRRQPRWPPRVARLRWRPMLRAPSGPWGGAVPPRREAGGACLGGCAPEGVGLPPLRWAGCRRSGTGHVQGWPRDSMLCLAQPPGAAHGQAAQGACACGHRLVRLAGRMHCSAGVRAGRAGKRHPTAACAARIRVWCLQVRARGCCAAARPAVLVAHTAAGALGARAPACVRAAPGVPATMPSRGSS